jgi:hypothetical protein
VKTGSLTLRAVVATLAVLLLALGGFATVITLRYRDGLRARARTQLIAGAKALQAAPTGFEVKQQIASLALEGIGVTFNGAGIPAKPGASKARTPLKPRRHGARSCHRPGHRPPASGRGHLRRVRRRRAVHAGAARREHDRDRGRRELGWGRPERSLVQRLEDLLDQIKRVLEPVLHARLYVGVAVLPALVVDEQRERGAPV